MHHCPVGCLPEGRAGVARFERSPAEDNAQTWMWFGSRKGRARNLLLFLAYEVYYWLCTLRGYRPRHFLNPLPDDLKELLPGDSYIAVWPRLPPSIRLLDKVFAGHVKFAPYTPEAAAEARAQGMCAEVMTVRAGVLQFGGGSE
jgi:hypothetical protein